LAPEPVHGFDTAAQFFRCARPSFGDEIWACYLPAWLVMRINAHRLIGMHFLQWFDPTQLLVLADNVNQFHPISMVIWLVVSTCPTHAELCFIVCHRNGMIIPNDFHIIAQMG
jgi:hypothetical protein